MEKNIPENCLLYVNQSYISTVKHGDLAVYHHNFIISQLIVAANQPSQIDQYICKDNEVELFTCMYDLKTDEFLGLSLLRMGFFAAAPKNLSHIFYNDETWQLYLTQRRSKKYMNHVTHPLSSADISIFSSEISKFCYIMKYRYRLYFDT